MYIYVYVRMCVWVCIVNEMTTEVILYDCLYDQIVCKEINTFIQQGCNKLIENESNIATIFFFFFLILLNFLLIK